MLNEWDLLAYIQRQLAAGVPLLTLQLVPDLSGTGRRPAPDAPDAYGHARDADGPHLRPGSGLAWSVVRVLD